MDAELSCVVSRHGRAYSRFMKEFFKSRQIKELTEPQRMLWLLLFDSSQTQTLELAMFCLGFSQKGKPSHAASIHRAKTLACPLWCLPTPSTVYSINYRMALKINWGPKKYVENHNLRPYLNHYLLKSTATGKQKLLSSVRFANGQFFLPESEY